MYHLIVQSSLSYIFTFLLFQSAASAPNPKPSQSSNSAISPSAAPHGIQPASIACSLKYGPSVFLPRQNDSETPQNTDYPVQWPITSTFYLALSPGGGSLNSEAVNCLLKDADKVAGKRVPGVFLEEKWGLRNGGFWGGVEFSVVPDKILGQSHLTWEDVANAVNGLAEWYREEGEFVFVYFLIKDKYRGQLGKGSVKRPWQEMPPIVTGPGGPANGGTGSIVERGHTDDEKLGGGMTTDALNAFRSFRTAEKG